MGGRQPLDLGRKCGAGGSKNGWMYGVKDAKKQCRGNGLMKGTLDYYNENAKDYINSTKNVEFAGMQDKFLGFLKPGDRVLDFGCGSGRDAKYFLEKGFRVDAVDGAIEFVKLASEYTGIQVKQMLFQDLDAVGIYDGIWACSSILHFPAEELEDVFGKMARALVDGGIVYASFKYGDWEGERNGRYFTDMTEGKMKCMLDKAGLFSIEDMWVTADVRPGREAEKWLNLILRKRK